MPLKKDILNVSVIEEETEEYPHYKQSDKEQTVVTSVFTKFRKAAEERDVPLEIFDGKNLREYVEDSFTRFNTSVYEREDIEDWQSRMFDPMTRNKQNALLGKITSALSIGQIKPRNDKDTLRASILDDLYQYSEEKDRYEIKMVNLFLSAMTNGTAFLYEGHRNKTKKHRVTYIEKGELKIEESYELKNILYSEIVPITEFYPATINVDTVEELPYCFRRQVIDFQRFRQDYAEYEKAEYVLPYGGTEVSSEPEPFYLQNISKDVGGGQVEIIKYYNQDVCEYVILANGIWLNPIGKNQEIAPLPYWHGELPFSEIKYELIGPGILYGKSFPERVSAIQDVLNALNNMLLDQAFLSVWPIIITNGIDSVEDDWIRPGRRIPIDTQGLPIDQAYSRLDLGTPSGFHQWITEYTRKILEEASIDQVSQGVAGVGGRTTAQEVRVAAEGVMNTLGMFGRYANEVVLRKTKLRAKNILQFWTDPEHPIEGIIGAQEFNKAFNTFQREGVTLEDGNRGTRIIEVYQDKEQTPTKAELDARADAYEIDTGEKLEIIAITPDSLRDMEFEVQYVANPKSQETRDVQLALELEKIRVYLSFFEGMVNKEELLSNVAVKFGDDPLKIMIPQDQQQQPLGDEENPEQAQQLGQEPQGAAAANLIRSEMQGIESPL